MRNLTCALFIAAAVVIGSGGAANAAIVGPDAAACEHGGPAMLVRVEGVKSRTGVLRVQAYGGDPSAYFDKGTYLRRVDVPVPPNGPIEVCIAVSRPGTFAVSVRHDINGEGKAGRADGGGLSGNPRLSLFDVMLHRKPDPASVQVSVHGVTPVPVVLNYVQGMSFGPIARNGR